MWVITAGDIAQLIRDQRKRLGLSQQALAQRAGVSRHWIIMLEKGKSSVELASVLRVLSVLGLRLDVRDARLLAHAEPAPPVATPAIPGAHLASETAPRRLATSRTGRRPTGEAPGGTGTGPRRGRKRGDS